MPDLLTIRRRAERGARPERAGILASGFGAVEPIRPATTATPAPAGTRPPAGPGPAAPGPAPRTGATARPYLPAPPPVSVRRTPAQLVPNAPPVPAVGRDAGSVNVPAVATPGNDVVLRRSLLDSTADLFGSMVAGSVIRRYDEPGGSHVSDNLPAPFGGAAIRRYAGGEAQALASSDVAAPFEPNTARQLDDLVDRVVDRIEQRVVDELERRGRRHNPGAF
jgi:hypothetical protein